MCDRKWIVAATTILILALALPWESTAQVPVDVSNETITCNTIVKGSIKISPALVFGGTAPSALYKVKGKLAGCVTSAPGVAIVDGKSSFSGFIEPSSNDCASSFSSAIGLVTVKWKASTAITPTSSTIAINAGALTSGLFSPDYGGNYPYFGLGINPRPSGSAGIALAVGGAFTGGDGGAGSTADFIVGEDISVFINRCNDSGVKALTITLGQFQLS